MRLVRPIAAASLALAAILAASATGRATPAGVPEDHSPEFLRYNRMHDDSVIVELSATDVSGLSANQRFRRTALLKELHAYRERGAFPHNYDFPGQLVPYFVDRKTGALCAVANLLAATGRRDVVERVARTNNNVWVQELAGDSTFRGWLSENGLTIEEAARIQLPMTTQTSMMSTTKGRSAAIALGVTGLAAGTGVIVTSLWNASGNSDGHLSKVSKFGMASGIIASAAGLGLMSSQETRTAGMYTLGAAITSVALSARSMTNHNTIAAADEAKKRSLAQVNVAPMVSVTNGGSAGMSMSLTF